MQNGIHRRRQTVAGNIAHFTDKTAVGGNQNDFDRNFRVVRPQSNRFCRIDQSNPLHQATKRTERFVGIVIVGKQNARGLSDDSVLPVSKQPQSRTVRRNNDPVFGDFQNCALAVFQNGRQGQNSVK